MERLGRNDKDLRVERLKKPVYEFTKGGKCEVDSGLELLFYPDGMHIDFGDMNHMVFIENKYMPRLIKLLEGHLKEVGEKC